MRQPHPTAMFKKIFNQYRSNTIRVMLCLSYFLTVSCGGPTKDKEINLVDNTVKEVVVEWYSVPDAGLLSIERKSEDSIAFTLLVGQGERCTGEASGIAGKQGDGSYLYGDSDCAIAFNLSGNVVEVKESGDLCDHGVHCSFDGSYSKMASEKVSPAYGDVMTWMSKSISEFSCVLAETYGHNSVRYPCGKEDTVRYHPAKASWYEGPEFPQEKYKDVHPAISNISVQFEHGSLQVLTITLREKMVLQDVQRIFSLPNAYDNYGNEKYPGIMAVTFDNHDPSENLTFSVNPVFVTSFTLTAFEHMGTGDMEEESEAIVETRTTYEYKETGSTYTLVNDGGPGPYEFTCGIASIKTSSDLPSQGKASYLAASMTDMDESTAWAEGKSGLGVGEWIEFKITDEYKKWGYNDPDFVSKAVRGDFIIQTGYAKSPALWKKNGRPLKLRCYLNNRAISIIQLRDSPDFQAFNIFEGTEKIGMKEGDVIRFEIIDVAQGTSDEDACISEFHIEASCG